MSTPTLTGMLLDGPAKFEYEKARQWTFGRRNYAVWIVIAYLFTIFALRRTMRDRKAFSLQFPLVIWNLCLAVFSMIGFYYVFDELLEAYQEQGLDGAICFNRRFFHGTCGYFAWLFTISKVAELGDSYFLVLRKRPLTFLQYYHHALTLIYCWFSYSESPVFNRIGTCLNYCVHSVMYFYFLLRSLHVSVPTLFARCITAFQIIQFIIATSLLTYGYVRGTFFGYRCDWPTTWANIALIMNVTYLFLFISFFYYAYIKKEKAN